MIIDFKNLKKEYDFIIVGAGIAGLALSRLIKNKKTILLIESGNFKFEKFANKKSFAKSKNLGNWPVANYSSYHSRVRMFGGNANVWGGWCMELDNYDFTNNEVWHILQDDLKTYYKEAYNLLNISPKKIPNNELSVDGIEPYTVNVSRGNFINESKEYVLKNQNIHLLINTNLDEILVKDSAVSAVNLKTSTGETLVTKPKKLIISCGGIETTSILLKNMPEENKNKNLGHYFMEHPQIQIGRVKIKNSDFNKFIKEYSPPTTKHLFDDKLNIRDEKYFSGFKTKNQKVRNYFVLRSTDVYQSKALYRLRHIILTKSISSTGVIKISDFYSLFIDILNMMLRKVQNLITNYKSYSVVLHLEQNPEFQNKIYFDNENNLVLDWKFTDQDIKNITESIKDLVEIFKGVDSVLNLKTVFKREERHVLSYINNNVFGIGHHMGTTMMGKSSESSVCNMDLKYHSLKNLYINSTSVFPSGGIANPTLTMLALTARLAEKLNNG